MNDAEFENCLNKCKMLFVLLVLYYHQSILIFSVSRLADLMEENVEELATIESIDSGAVYTLALKTHVGMSIDTFRYFAGWCDKIQVCNGKVEMELHCGKFSCISKT